MRFGTIVAALFMCATPVWSAVYNPMNIDNTQSNLGLTVTITGTPYTDSDSSSVSGSIGMEVIAGPSLGVGQAKFIAMNMALDNDLHILIDLGFLGGIEATATALTLTMANPLPDFEPYDIALNTPDFTQSNVWMTFTGQLHYRGYGVIGGALGEGDWDLSTLDPVMVPTPPGVGADFLEGMHVRIPLDVTQEIVESGVSITIQVAGDILAIPEPASLAVLALGGLACWLRRRT